MRDESTMPQRATAEIYSPAIPVTEEHAVDGRIGILLTNLGTPAAPTTAAVRRYLAEFLMDPRVVEIPRPLWWLILYGVILPWRAPRSAKLYQKIWQPEGSPLRIILQQQAQALQQQLGKQFWIIPAMRYGQPSLQKALQQFHRAAVQKILLFPLYPQYAAATTASTFDAVARILRTFRWQPALRTIQDYHADREYIQAIADSVRCYWQQHGETERLLFSFHGLPQSTIAKGDPYYGLCHTTARLIAQRLAIPIKKYAVTFQSRVGRTAWLQPYTDQQLQRWAKEGIGKVTVVCPGFSADCLETLEEIVHLNRQLFCAAGGKELHYVPALNAQPSHIFLLAKLIKQHTQGWTNDREEST